MCSLLYCNYTMFTVFYYMWVCGYLGDVLQLFTHIKYKYFMGDKISFPGIMFYWCGVILYVS
jgi:hypothetical protein